MIANGALAGLVAVTAPCAFVAAPSAVLIGGLAGVLVCVSVLFWERVARLAAVPGHVGLNSGVVIKHATVGAKSTA
jgi:Amt family ammonium transporter